MSGEEAGQQAPAKTRRYFRPKSSQPQISREAAAREGAILRIAVAALGLQEAQAFLNRPNEELDGRPLSIATGSAEGYQAVAAAIAAMTPVPTIAAQHRMMGGVLRVARMTDGEHAGRWGLWSDAQQRWASVLYETERDAREALRHLAGEPTARKRV